MVKKRIFGGKVDFKSLLNLISTVEIVHFYIYMFGKSSSSGEKIEFHVSNLCVGKCSATILRELIEELEGLDAYRLNKALASMI